MVGRALCNNLKAIRDMKNRTRPDIEIEEIYEYDITSGPERNCFFNMGKRRELLSMSIALST